VRRREVTRLMLFDGFSEKVSHSGIILPLKTGASTLKIENSSEGSEVK
jgi:hypothetical protein